MGYNFVQLFGCIVEYSAQPLLLEGIVLGSWSSIFKLLRLELPMAVLTEQLAMIGRDWVDFSLSGALSRADCHLHGSRVETPR